MPNYYKDFKCIADKCRHSCCIGWEIDIDENSMSRYKSLDGEVGNWVRDNISKGEVPHFILDEKERCPFLNENGLCDMILKLGEDALCNICADHPRFRNFYSSFTEMGIGICCEEAARVILNSKETFSLEVFEGDENIEIYEDEEFYLNLREQIFAILKRSDVSILQRFEILSEKFGFKFSDFSLCELCEKYISLERLDKAWGDILEKAKNQAFDLTIFEKEEFQKPFENLACYFVFRHFCDAMWDGKTKARVKFILAGCYMIGALCSASCENIEEIARMYSSEIEYSEENTAELLDFLED